MNVMGIELIILMFTLQSFVLHFISLYFIILNLAIQIEDTMKD